MNIFFVDQDPTVAAQSLMDMHVNKMVTETAQILSNCYSLERLAEPDCIPNYKGEPRGHSYPHHPCCKWPQKSKANFDWVIKHGLALEEERLYRGMNPSFPAKFIRWCAENPPHFDNEELTPPSQSFGEWNHLQGDDPVEAYRRYYNIAKRQQATLRKTWTRRGAPSWWLNDE